MSNHAASGTPGEQPQGKKKVSIEIPKDLEAVYANIAFISHTPAEMIIDFAQFLPRTPKGSVVSRIIMSPMHAKMLHAALSQNIAKYEQQFGEIRMPQRTNLADELFRFRPGQGDDDDEGDE